MSENIKVAVRLRPFLPHETPAGCVAISGNQLVVGDHRAFAFDTVFDMRATSDDVYVSLGQPLADSVMQGFNASMIAYGQTGAGKTYTMEALVHDTVEELFCRLQEEEEREKEQEGGASKMPFWVRLSALEVYNETLNDLLLTTRAAQGGQKKSNGNGAASPTHAGPSSSNALQLREDPNGGVFVPGLTEIDVRNSTELLALIDDAIGHRKTASTLMNATSSRSHCVLTLTVHRRAFVSRCCFVDLAGSERFKKSLGVGLGPGAELGAAGGKDGANATLMTRMREGININSGLLALGNVIVALCEKKPHVPYRSSKLTRLLQPMLGGNSRTAMIACIAPLASSLEETFNTLKYADRAKSIQTDPHLVLATVNTQAEADATIFALRRELEEVQRQLAAYQAAPGEASPAVSPTSGKAKAKKKAAAPRSADEQHLVRSLKVRVGELQALLVQEQQLTKRLEEDLFNAEYAAMVETEKRKELQERVDRLERGSSTEPRHTDTSVDSSSTPVSSSEPTPRTRMTKNIERLQVLESERESLVHLKAAREADTARLRGALGEEETVMTEEDYAFEQLAINIEEKEAQIAALQHDNEVAAKQLAVYEARLKSVVADKTKLEHDLAKAEHQLESTAMERQQREMEKAKLRAEYAQHIRTLEEKAVNYRKRVQQAEQEVQSRAANIERERKLRAQILALREAAAKQRQEVRSDMVKRDQHSAAQQREIQQLKSQLEQSEQHTTQLQARLQRKDREIAEARKMVMEKSSTSSGHPQRIVKRRNESKQATRARGATGVVQAEINKELQSLAQLEEELAELQTYRTVLLSTRDTEAPRWNHAIRGFRGRLKYLQEQLQQDSLDPAQRARLAGEEKEIQRKVDQLQSYRAMFEDADQHLAEFDNRIENLNEARKFHLHRVRRLQSTAARAETRRQSALSETDEAPLPSVRELVQSREGLAMATEQARPTATVATTAAASLRLKNGETTAYIARLEAQVAHLTEQSEAMRMEMEQIRAIRG